MYILWMILIGFVVGVVARMLMPGKESGGFFMTALLGILGAFVGTFFGQVLGFYNRGEPAGLVMSVFGALLLLFLVKKYGTTAPVSQS